MAPRRAATLAARARFAILAAALDLGAATAAGLAVALVHHAAAGRPEAPAEPTVEFSLALAAIFVILDALRGGYAMGGYLDAGGHLGRVAPAWSTAFVLALVSLFAVRETAVLSRLPTVLFYLAGMVAVAGARLALSRHLQRRIAEGRVRLARIVIAGEEEELRRFLERHDTARLGIDVAASVVLRGQGTLAEDARLAAAIARIVRPDDVLILASWTRPEVVEAAVAAFAGVPAALHLGPHRGLDRFGAMRIGRIGPITSVNIVRAPLSPVERLAKRAMDLALAPLLLVVAAPLLLLAALAIRLDSPGPVLFVQRRGGFNQHGFRLYKLRTMRACGDGRTIRQAVPGDARVTRVGRWLRRCNIDELPQLWNVVRGEMSLVGPRPHAVAHDQLYARAIGDYARRHNVKPGLTGWAQVHGLRGATTEAAMEARIAHDLYYIDNWSLGMDIAILARTLLSPRAFRNAC